ncbi:MAG: hypothetical protein K2N06_05985 [Oscillospiraceae bacterium]|nr:hypothetical protein [Oscillospiraceae bacterium]
MENKLTQELIEKAKQAKSAEELLSLAKENEIELSEIEAKAYFEQLNKSGELSDEELDNVSGGGCHTNVDGKKYTVVTSGNPCFTGQYQKNSCRNGKYIRNDNNTLRDIWGAMLAEDHNGGNCGNCIHLAFKGGTGYCDLSGE